MNPYLAPKRYGPIFSQDFGHKTSDIIFSDYNRQLILDLKVLDGLTYFMQINLNLILLNL
jgi:hypothetical protein